MTGFQATLCIALAAIAFALVGVSMEVGLVATAIDGNTVAQGHCQPEDEDD